MLEVFYYVVVILSIVMYFIAIKFYKLRLFSFSTVSYVMAFFLAMLPGYKISAGAFYNSAFTHGFDLDIYILYLFFSMLFPIAIIMGNIAGKNYYLYSEPRNHIDLRMKLTVVLIVVYSFAYFLWLPFIPINSLLTGSANLGEVAIQRISITHQLAATSDNLPFLFRYWRNIIQNLFFIVFVYFIASNKIDNKRSKIFLIMLFLLLAYNLTFTLEKASIIYAVAAIFFVNFMQVKKINFKNLVIAFSVLLLISFSLIYFFMGGENVFDVVDAFIVRLTEQTCSVYLQIEYIRQYGHLLFRGIYMPLISHVVDPQYNIDLSRWAYANIFPLNADIGMIGSAGGMAMAELYFLFSWFCLPIFLVVMLVYGWIDSILINSVYAKNISIEMININMAFYIYFMTVFSLALTGSVFGILSFPFIVSPEVFIIIMFYLLYTKVSSISLRRCAS